MADPKLLEAYIDESGDRGWGGRSTDCFVLAAVVVRSEDVSAALQFRRDICVECGKPLETELHWAENLRTHTHRKHVSSRIGQFDRIKISGVVVHKPSLIGTGTGLSDHARMYNYAVRRLLERLSWFARSQQRPVVPTFAHIRRFPYERLTEYLGVLKQEQTEIRWNWLRQHRIEQPKRRHLLQLADLTAGAIYAAVERDQFGNHEPAYLMNLAPRFYRRPPGAITSYGLNFVAPAGHWTTYPWWTEFEQRCT